MSTWGDEAIDLMATVGVTLDPGQRETICDGMSEGADRKWLASEVADVEPRQNGKGVILETRALSGLLLVKEPLIIWTAHEFKTAHQGFMRMRHYFDNYDHLRKRVRTIRSSTHSTEIILKTGQTLAFLARSGGSGRGFAGVSPLFLDEAFALTAEQVAAIMYATSAAANPQVWYMSSAPLADSEVLRETCKRGRRGARGLVYYEWSARGRYDDLFKLVEQNKALSDEDEDTAEGQELRGRLFAAVAEANRAFGIRISESSILREVRATGVEQFLRERLGVYSELETGAAIDAERWKKLGDPESRRDGDVAIAVDIAPERDWAAIGLYGHRADDLGHVQLIHYGPVAGLLDKIAEYRDALDPVAVGMARGTYASLREDLKKRGIIRPEDRGDDDEPSRSDDKDPRRGDLVVLGGTDMAAACGQILDATKESTIRHVPAKQLDDAVGVGKTRRTGESIAWARTDRAVDITALVAVTEARWSFYARRDAKPREDEYDPLGNIF
ncbi:hypothetical protein FHR83_007024 [Actinoplanes campanulatus]|uniref:Phage terminase-like protein, large subunit, contains N-terminal HTH domain n=1 Tax=Actinoplanes campanulatus TaxID=113559 RepID=A0A7W5AN25_9ACTN|nr:terminase [Actinoplanes campanulatus]MBB3099318.1 hypothetical protein [Actinoplanes campanulatus]